MSKKVKKTKKTKVKTASVEEQLAESTLANFTTPEQLAALATAVEKKREELINEQEKIALSDPEVLALRDQLKSLWEEYNKTWENTKIEYPITLVLSFSASEFSSFEEFLESAYGDMFDVRYLDCDVAGTIKNTDGKLSKTQFKLLKEAAENTIDNACGQIKNLLPKEHLDKSKEFQKKFENIKKKLENKQIYRINDLSKIEK